MPARTAMYRVTIGRTRGVRGPDALEQGIVGVIIVGVVAIAIWYGVQLVRISQSLEAVSLAQGAEIDASLERATLGHWPSPNDATIVVPSTRGTYVTQLAMENDGVVTAHLTLGSVRPASEQRPAVARQKIRGDLSFRPVLLGSADAPAILYLCGYATPPAGAIASNTINHTTLPRKYLPPLCR